MPVSIRDLRAHDLTSCLGWVGVIEAGRAADLLVVDGDPHENISAIRDVAMVLRDGRIVVDTRAES